MADELLVLVLEGKKTAITGTEADEVGEQITIQDGLGNPKAIIEIIEVTQRRFKEVDESFAHDEGEGDQTLEYWRKAHKEFFTREGTYSDDMQVYCERFKLIGILRK